MATATEALLEAQTAYTTLRPATGTVLPTNELGNLTLAPGTYTSPASMTSRQASDSRRTGESNAVWIFQMGTYLTVGSPSASESIVLTGGAQAKNVFWQVGSAATINYGGGGTMVGTIISQAGLTISSPGQSTTSTVTTLDAGRCFGGVGHDGEYRNQCTCSINLHLRPSSKAVSDGFVQCGIRYVWFAFS